MKFSMLLVLCGVLLVTGCISTQNVRYELKESAGIKNDPLKGITWSTDVTFSETW